MQNLYLGAKAAAGSLALVGGTVAAAAAILAAAPAVASGSQDNFAYGSYAPAGAITGGPNDLAMAPPADTEVAHNVNINGLLFTGTTTDTAGTASAYSRVTNVSTPSTVGSALSWASGGTTYGFTLSASLVNAYCGTAGDTVSINSGKLTETSSVTATGVQLSKQVFNLPQHPAIGQTYTYNGGTAVLNTQATVSGVTQVTGITITTGAGTPQTLFIAVAGCETGGGPGAITNGTFGTGGTPSTTGWTTATTGGGSVTISAGAGPSGDNAADLAGSGTAGSATLSQSFIADGTLLSLVFKQSCTPGAGGLTITLQDTTTNSTAGLVTPSPRCSNDTAFKLITQLLTPGDHYKLTVTNTNTAGHSTATLLAEVAIGLTAPTPPPSPSTSPSSSSPTLP
jgi:hypothetical protein